MRPRQLLLGLLVCGWVALLQAGDVPWVTVKVDPKTLQDNAKQAIKKNNIAKEVAEIATKNQSGNKAIKGMKGLKVKDIQPPKVYIGFSPDQEIRIWVFLNVTISGQSFLGNKMHLTIVSNMSTHCSLKQVSEKEMKLEVKKCSVELLSCKTNLPQTMLPKIVNKFLYSTLGKVLPGMICPTAKKFISVMEEQMGEMFVSYAVGNHGTMQYKLERPPELTEAYIGLILKPEFHDKDGNEVEIPSDPPAPDSMPEKKEGKTEIIIRVNLLNAWVTLLRHDFNCEVTRDKVPSFTRDKLADVMPLIAGELPPSEEVKAEIRLTKPPTFSLAPEESSLEIHSNVNFITPADEKTVLSLEMIQNWKMNFSVGDKNLKTESIAVRTSDISVIFPSADGVDVKALEEFMKDIVSAACMPNVNRIMADNGMPLPSQMGSNYSGSETDITHITNGLILDVTPDSSPLDFAVLAKELSDAHKKHH